jgi:hypothetical protein
LSRSEQAPTLGELAALIRSKNAGPFMLTIDVMFADEATYRRVKDSACLSAASLSELYGVPESAVSRFDSDSALAVKVSFPRPWPSGSARDRDVYGGQLHAPLVLMPVDDS